MPHLRSAQMRHVPDSHSVIASSAFSVPVTARSCWASG